MATQHDLPALNSRVELRLEESDDWYRSIVQDLEGGDVVVSTPTDERGLNVAAAEGAVIRVFWHTPAGPLEVATELVTARVGTLSLWTLHPIQAVHGASRRSFFRVPMSGPVELAGALAGARAQLLDLSEGGLRCHVRADAVPEVGEPVELTLVLEGTRVAATAEVVRRRADDLGHEMSMRFVDMAPSDSDVIRHHLFAEQRRLRAKGLV